MAAALQWRPPFYKRSVGEFYCFFYAAFSLTLSLFPLPLTFLLYLCQKAFFLFFPGAFRALPAPVLKVFLHNMARQRGGNGDMVDPKLS